MVEGIRKEELRKVPGVAETLDWAAALVGLDVRDLHDAPETVHETLMCLLKTHEDKSRVTREVSERLLGKVACAAAAPVQVLKNSTRSRASFRRGSPRSSKPCATADSP
jgi:hypothetical protein